MTTARASGSQESFPVSEVEGYVITQRRLAGKVAITVKNQVPGFAALEVRRLSVPFVTIDG